MDQTHSPGQHTVLNGSNSAVCSCLKRSEPQEGYNMATCQPTVNLFGGLDQEWTKCHQPMRWAGWTHLAWARSGPQQLCYLGWNNATHWIYHSESFIISKPYQHSDWVQEKWIKLEHCSPNTLKLNSIKNHKESICQAEIHMNFPF